MRRTLSKTSGRRSGLRVDRVLGGKSRRPNNSSVGKKLQEVLSGWERLDSKFIDSNYPSVIALKLFNLGYEEEFELEALVERENILLFGVMGIEKDLNSSRLLGYLLAYDENPVVHSYTFFSVLAYSKLTDIGAKRPRLIYRDKHLNFYKLGMGTIDYLLGYRNRTRDHDVAHTSSGSVHAEFADSWRDGM